MKQSGTAVCLTVVLASVLSAPARADTAVDTLLALNNSVSFSFMASQLAYGEHAQGPSSPYLDTDQGRVNGGKIVLSGMRRESDQHLYVRLSFSTASGHVNYNGGVTVTNGSGAVVGSFPLQERQFTRLTDEEVRVGEGFALGARAMWTPYIAVGAHDWYRSQPATAAAPWDYVEKYSHEYAAGGVLLQYAPSARFATSLTLAVGRTIDPRITAPAYGFSANLGSQPWEQAGLALDYRALEHVSFFAGATFTTFRYGASSVDPYSGLMEPYSHTNVIDYEAGVRALY